QAEDGIRDKLVTGVQTCALPISNRCTTSWAAPITISFRQLVRKEIVIGAAHDVVQRFAQLAAEQAVGKPEPAVEVFADQVNRQRSEERRVGKGCRLRRCGIHEKK